MRFVACFRVPQLEPGANPPCAMNSPLSSSVSWRLRHGSVRGGETSMTGNILERIAGGRTDLVFDYLAQGHPAKIR